MLIIWHLYDLFVPATLLVPAASAHVHLLHLISHPPPPLPPCHRSTNLDGWSVAQLRGMKVGGNAAAAEFFQKNGGQNLLSLQDGKQKYTSRVALAYKDEIDRRKADDAKR